MTEAQNNPWKAYGSEYESESEKKGGLDMAGHSESTAADTSPGFNVHRTKNRDSAPFLHSPSIPCNVLALGANRMQRQP